MSSYKSVPIGWKYFGFDFMYDLKIKHWTVNKMPEKYYPFVNKKTVDKITIPDFISKADKYVPPAKIPKKAVSAKRVSKKK